MDVCPVMGEKETDTSARSINSSRREASVGPVMETRQEVAGPRENLADPSGDVRTDCWDWKGRISKFVRLSWRI